MASYEFPDTTGAGHSPAIHCGYGPCFQHVEVTVDRSHH